MRCNIYFAFALLFLGLSSPAFPALLGDADGNEKLDLGDAVFFLQAQAGLRSDGELAEAMAVLQALVGLNPLWPDKIPPSAPVLAVPTDLDVGSTYVRLLWHASSDAFGVAGYYIYRDAVKIGETVGATTYTDKANVNPNTSYTYQIKAFDTAGNVSLGSNAVTLSTPPSPGSVVVSGGVQP